MGELEEGKQRFLELVLPHLGGIDYHNKIAGEGVRRIGGLIFALKGHGNVPGHAAQYLPGDVDDAPVDRDLSRLGKVGASSLHAGRHLHLALAP